MARSATLAMGLLGIFLLSSMTFSQECEQPLIERLDIRGHRRVPDVAIRSYIQARAGGPYSKDQLESDLRALYRTNFFENIEIQEREGDTGKIITFIVKENPIILSVEYLGNKSFTESDILDVYVKNKATPPLPNAWYNPQMIWTGEHILKDLMIQHGKPRGTVHTEIETVLPAMVRVRFVLDEDGEVPR